MAPVFHRIFRIIILSGVMLCSGMTSATLAQAPPASPQNPGQPPGQPPRPAEPPGKITGRVLRADTGQPLLKASVTLTPDGRFAEQQVVRVNKQGAFEFFEVSPGRYRLTAERNGYVRQTYGQRGGGPGVVLEVKPRQTIDTVQFSLERGGIISGMVVDEDNEAVEGVEVRAQRVVFQPGGKQRTSSVRIFRTDDLGAYRLSGLAPGFYYVQVAGRDGVGISQTTQAFSYAPAYYPGVAAREDAQRVQVTAANETRRIDFSLRPGASYSVTGIIVDPDPPPGVLAYAVGVAAASGWASFGVSGDDRKFTIRNLEPGEHLLFAMTVGPGGEQRRGYGKVTVTDSDQRIVIEIGKTATISGEIKFAGESAGAPAPGRMFVGLQTDGEPFPLGSSPVTNNHFEIKGVAEGSYTFSFGELSNSSYLKEARCGGDDYAVRKMTVAANQIIDDCVLLVGRDVATASVAATRESKPAEGAIVIFIPQEEDRRKQARMYATAQTDSAGAATVRGIVPGEYYVYALPVTDTLVHYDSEFYSRNRDTAMRVMVHPNEQLTLALTVVTPK